MNVVCLLCVCECVCVSVCVCVCVRVRAFSSHSIHYKLFWTKTVFS